MGKLRSLPSILNYVASMLFSISEVKTIALVGLLIGLLYVTGATFCLSLANPRTTQSKEKVLNTGITLPNAPIKVVNAKVAKQDIKFGERFEATDEWLKGAEFKFKNTSNNCSSRLLSR